MTRFIIRRLLVSIPVLFGIIFLVFVDRTDPPGRPVHGDPRRACDRKSMRRSSAPGSGWTSRSPTSSCSTSAGPAPGDLGTSIQSSEPVTELIVERLPTTIELTLLRAALRDRRRRPAGHHLGDRRNSAADVGTMVVANLGVSIPVFVLGLLLAYVFAVAAEGDASSRCRRRAASAGRRRSIPLVEVWGLEDLEGIPRAILDFMSGIYTLTSLITFQWEALVDAFRHLILPAIALGTIPLAIIARITRSSLLDVLGLDYIRTARAKGLDDRLVLRRHALRNAMLPVVTIIGLQIGILLGGAVLTETIFNLAGVGKTVFDAIAARDYVVIQGFTLIIAIGFLVVNLIVDISYAWLDPRVRLS